MSVFLYTRSGLLARRSRKIGATVIAYTKKIAKLHKAKIKFEFNNDADICMSLDTVNFNCQEFRLDPSA